MVTIAIPFDTQAVTEQQWSQMMSTIVPTSIIRGSRLELAVFAQSDGMQVYVRPGSAWVKGHYYDRDDQATIAIPASDPANPRIDRIVLQVDWTNNNITYVRVPGVVNAAPAVPALTQTAAIWQIPLAQVRVNAGVATIAAGNVTDERTLAWYGGLGDQTFDGVNANVVLPAVAVSAGTWRHYKFSAAVSISKDPGDGAVVWGPGATVGANSFNVGNGDTIDIYCNGTTWKVY